jgi:hypothetical protein
MSGKFSIAKTVSRRRAPAQNIGKRIDEQH